ncbi:hypothetical protein C5167_036525 [Papaver somniferum]|uniref:Uncharacterized protein n=1 Tax=Papaver somniferum TaxID=3469 RepID=A0A4Y7I7T7_PAPSO|nr:hypothetical protein C5167_036525 [Papaver somniferum]
MADDDQDMGNIGYCLSNNLVFTLILGSKGFRIAAECALKISLYNTIAIQKLKWINSSIRRTSVQVLVCFQTKQLSGLLRTNRY